MEFSREELASLGRDFYQMSPITIIPATGYRRTNGDWVMWPPSISFLPAQRKEIQEVAWYASMNIATQVDSRFFTLSKYINNRSSKVNSVLIYLDAFVRYNNNRIEVLKKSQNKEITELKKRVDALELQVVHLVAANLKFGKTSISKFS